MHAHAHSQTSHVFCWYRNLFLPWATKRAWFMRWGVGHHKCECSISLGPYVWVALNLLLQLHFIALEFLPSSTNHNVIYSAILYTLQIFKHPLYHQYPPPISYQLNFLKWCISQVKYECRQSMFSDVPPENTHTFSSLLPLFHLSPLTFSLSCSLIQGRGWESGSVWWTLWALWLPYFPATLHTYKSLFQVIPDSEATYM